MKTLRQVYNTLYKEAKHSYLRNCTEDRASRLANILAVKLTARTWKAQYDRTRLPKEDN